MCRFHKLTWKVPAEYWKCFKDSLMINLIVSRALCVFYTWISAKGLRLQGVRTIWVSVWREGVFSLSKIMAYTKCADFIQNIWYQCAFYVTGFEFCRKVSNRFPGSKVVYGGQGASRYPVYYCITTYYIWLSVTWKIAKWMWLSKETF